MRKNIKTCIYVITAILPIVLSACSNRTDDTNTLKTVEKSTVATTTFVEDTSSNVTNTTVETTTEEDTTELISETEQDTSEDVTKQQQTTIITSVSSTPVPVQTTPTPRPTETDQTTTPVMITPPDRPDSPDNKVLLKGIKGIGEKYSYKGKEFIIDEVAYGDVSLLSFSIDISVTDTFTISQLPFEMYCRYDIYNSDGNCVKTGCFNFICDVYHMPDETTNPSSSSIYIKKYFNSAFDIDDLPPDEYTIVFLNYE